MKYSLSIGLRVYQGSYSFVVPYLYRAMLLHFFDEIKCRAEHDGITDIFWRGAGRRRAHERIATKKLCLPLVTSRGGGRRGESRRERPDVSWRRDG